MDGGAVVGGDTCDGNVLPGVVCSATGREIEGWWWWDVAADLQMLTDDSLCPGTDTHRSRTVIDL